MIIEVTPTGLPELIKCGYEKEGAQTERVTAQNLP